MKCIREHIINYVYACNEEYNALCKDFTMNVTAEQVVSLSFIFCPSLTYLDLSTCEFTSQTKAIQTWINWRKFIDNRLEIIYRLDLEDKNQVTRCSNNCLKIYQQMLKYTVDFAGFPGYYRIHGMNEPQDIYLLFYPTLEEGIMECVTNSHDKEAIIRKIVSAVQRFGIWLNIDEYNLADKTLYEYFLNILIENNTKDIFLVDKLLNHSNVSTEWIHIGNDVLNYLAKTKRLNWLINRNVYFSGNCGLVLELLCLRAVPRLKFFIRHGLYPLNEKGIIILKDMNYDWETEFPYRIRKLFRKCLKREYVEFKKYVEFSGKFQLTNIQILTYIAMYFFKYQKNVETLKIIWRCIPNAYLTFEDFQQLFKELPDKMTKQLRCIFDWYQKVVMGKIESNSPEKIESNGPRKLKHYCRCVIRRRLGENFNLPYGIDTLPVSISEKDYLRLKY